jgi:hypothetical protein
MKTSARYMELMRRKARRRLDPNFSRRVIEDAQNRRLVRARLRLVAITGAISMLTVISVHLIRNQFVQQQNLQSWEKTAAQIDVIEQSI